MTLLIYVDISKEVRDDEHLKVFADVEAVRVILPSRPEAGQPLLPPAGQAAGGEDNALRKRYAERKTRRLAAERDRQQQQTDERRDAPIMAVRDDEPPFDRLPAFLAVTDRIAAATRPVTPATGSMK